MLHQRGTPVGMPPPLMLRLPGPSRSTMFEVKPIKIESTPKNNGCLTTKIAITLKNIGFTSKIDVITTKNRSCFEKIGCRKKIVVVQPLFLWLFKQPLFLW